MPLAKYATWKRSVKLLDSFRYEQKKPQLFYNILAADTYNLLNNLSLDFNKQSLFNKTILDVGGGPGYFYKIFSANEANYFSVEYDERELGKSKQLGQSNLIQGSGMDLPIRSNSVDVCFSSNVAEHVKEPWEMGKEMLRVTKPGGLMVISYTLWYGPFGGHEMGLSHYFGGERAKKWYINKHKKLPKNIYGESLFKVTAKDGLQWGKTVRSVDAELLLAIPRYLPSKFWWLMRTPILREILGSNLLLAFKKNL